MWGTSSAFSTAACTVHSRSWRNTTSPAPAPSSTGRANGALVGRPPGSPHTHTMPSRSSVACPGTRLVAAAAAAGPSSRPGTPTHSPAPSKRQPWYPHSSVPAAVTRPSDSG